MKTILILVLLTITQSAFGANTRRTVIISDTHLGIGKDDHDWHPYEDFRWATEFKAFLDYLQAGVATDLVLNGDSFELWQSRADDDCRYADRNLSCTEADALARMQPIITAHR